MDTSLFSLTNNIVPAALSEEVKRSFIDYAMSVIVSRALPDVRDGLKPVQRRILYCMREDLGLTYDKPFCKSAKTTGQVMGDYHPHGDASIYETMVHMGQWFSMRHMLIEKHGGFGTIAGASPSAPRYTEAKLSLLASEEMLSDIRKNTVDFINNYDNRLTEPTVLPCRFPNLLVNGSIGIAVGMATNIPPHNLGEVIDGTVAFIDDPEIDIPTLMNYIKGPDFPTGGTICGVTGIYEAYMTGRGKMIVRGKGEIDESHRRIVFTEIPFMVTTTAIIKQIRDCVNDGRLDGITDVRDESDLDNPCRIVVDYRRDANPEIILNSLYSFTQLQDTFAANMLSLVGGVPKTLNLKQMIEYYVAHQIEVITRRTQFELDAVNRRIHIYEGYKIAVDNIDRVIAVIRASENPSAARVALQEEFNLSEAQAQAIVDMTLGKLSKMGVDDIMAELNALYAEAGRLTFILSDEREVRAIIKSDLLEIKKRHSEPRRTELAESADEILSEDLIPKHTCVLTLTSSGYIKRQPADTYSVQRRGGKGIIGTSTRDAEDEVAMVLTANSHHHIMFFTNDGVVQIKKAYMIPEGGRTSKGAYARNLLDLDEGERITAMFPVPDLEAEDKYLFFVTKNGTVKRTALSEYSYQRKGGKRAINLDEGDELVYVRLTGGDAEMIIASSGGRAIRFAETDARVMGRTARGVRGVRLKDGDSVVGAVLVEEGKHLITVTANGFGKLTEFDEFTAHNRGGQGVRAQNVTEKTGELIGIAAVSGDEDLLMITDAGTIIRIPVSGISQTGRSAQGVTLMRTKDGARVASFSPVPSEKPTADEAVPEDSLEEPTAPVDIPAEEEA